MPLPWVRLDANIATHDKILALLGDSAVRRESRWQAVAVYMFALGWAGGQGTDGHITPMALPMVHGNSVIARLLVKHGLWEENGAGWHIRNYEQRQELAVITEGKRAAQRRAALRTNCIRRHGKDCGCWRKENP